MFWTDTKRILRSGFSYFWRNGFVSLASILVMVITLFVVGMVIFTGAMLSSALEDIRSKVDVNVYFLPTASEEQVIALKGSIEALPEVASVEYISREQALLNFRERHQNDEETLQALEELGENPLGAVLNIRARETAEYETIATFLQDEETRGDTIIDTTNYFDNKTAIDRLERFTTSAETLGFVLMVLLGVISVAITFNTIRLATYVSREEISVMRLVGASNFYIRGPFVVSGILYGALSAVITLAVFYPLSLALGPTTERFFGSTNMFEYYVTHFSELLLILLATGIFLGGVSSWLAVHRYLRV